MKSDDVGNKVLEELGFSVRKLPETSEEGRRADFIAKLDRLTLLVETKLREDDPKELARMERELAEKGSYESDHKLGKSNALSSNIRDAVEQLEAEREEPHDFKVLLYLVACINPDVVCEQIEDTLYGTTSVMRMKRGRPGLEEIKCYFYRESEFHPAKSLDAAIVGFESYGRWVLNLCLNPFSSRFEAIKGSALARMFEGRTIDPFSEEKQGKALLPSPDAPRPTGARKKYERMFSAADGMLRHLEEKYGYPLGSLMQGHFNKPLIIRRRPL